MVLLVFPFLLCEGVGITPILTTILMLAQDYCSGILINAVYGQSS